MYRTVSLAISLVAVAFAQHSALPQCSPSFNGTIGNGTAGSEQQISSTTLRIINATDADQGVAVDADHFYSIDNFSITKHRKATGQPILQWYGGEDGAIIHLDGGVVINGTLYAPHSNYPGLPISSSIEMWDVSTMTHVGSHPFGIYRGSLTWVDQNPVTGVWYGAFANYDRIQTGQTVPYGLTMNTQFVEFTGPPNWEVVRSWIFPEELYATFSPMSNSGGSFGPDGWLYITGHDASAAYVLKIPGAGSVLIWVATIDLPDIAGQGIAWDRSGGKGKATLYGISRASRQVVEMRVSLQTCSWMEHVTVGTILGPGEFVDTSQD
ncbi:hypothetical protein NA57DRAFT_74200 [Rhizodiscina lignyota]|uniref:Uncharacterized protein n=1 Tax=Rhizodiscina lignyota TaxID=1504668 RepID=A0A9P4IJW2_9PEZI|nr:hypothetical protein NA57DRAFT_74200 [Rhizodiscina lignyota]